MTSDERSALKARALELGRTAPAGAWQELIRLLASDSADVRRAAASACGKVAKVRGDDAHRLMMPLLRAIEKEARPQTLQYMLRAFWHCAPYITEPIFNDIVDLARNPTSPPFIRELAAEVAARTAKTHNEQVSRTRHWCARCRKPVTADESRAGIERYGKPYCHRCFDERRLSEVCFEAEVARAKRLRVTDEVHVQSRGEKRIAAYLESKRIAYLYDENYRICGDKSIRPDFYLPEFDVYIEYWGMDTDEYLRRKREKLFLYQRAHLKLVSLDESDLPALESVLEEKLSRYIRLPSGA